MTEQTPSLSDEQIQDLLRVGNPTDEECRLIRMGWDAAMRASASVMWVQLSKDLLREVERNTCSHEETHRAGFLWEVCDMCGAAWAADEGGKPDLKRPEVVERARTMLHVASEFRND